MQPSISRIAHISDVHLLAPRPQGGPGGHDLRVRFLSFGRALDAAARRKKLLRSLRTAMRSGADHVVVSGDLTESGTEAQFEALAEVLDEAAIEPERLTLVPGNHDAYTAPDAWARALDGPLRRWALSSAREPGAILERGGLAILPVDCTFHQPITRSAGLVTDDALDRLEARLADPATSRRTTLLVQHHPPYAHGSRAWQWIDGLCGAARLTTILARFPEVHLMHGHLHRAVDRAVTGLRTRIFGAPALVEDHDDAPRVRLYEVRHGLLESAGLAA
jgi:3',5'-cyclic AMP phosphodiesterase CpdA